MARIVVVLPGLVLCITAGFAQVPGEITGVEFTGSTTAAWDAQAPYDSYNVYRGALSDPAAGVPARCRSFDVETASVQLPDIPVSGTGYYYLITGQETGQAEGPAGLDSDSNPRRTLGSCLRVMRNHVLDRLGYGWDEWTRDRIAALGIDGYIAEQLNPGGIDEHGNDALADALNPIDPPDHVDQLIRQDIIRAVYSRRQLEQQVVVFWTNHFNTYWPKAVGVFQGLFPFCEGGIGVPPECDGFFPQEANLMTANVTYEDMQDFRNIGFKGNFRDMLEANSTSLPMMIYLDTWVSVVGIPNENYGRELMELHTMGADCHTQDDVEALSRVFTGWSGCKKTVLQSADPLASCIETYWEEPPVGKWVPHFDPALHDCAEKILFAGTPQELTIPDTCGSPAAGVVDRTLALDAIAAHPCTAEFISRKVLQRFVTDDPDQALVDQIVAVWNDAGNTFGVGDLPAVLQAVFTSDAFLDPLQVGSKIKTPFEHMASALRATRGVTNGDFEVFGYLLSMKQPLRYKTSPDGFPESGSKWIATSNTLDRQNFGIDLLTSTHPLFRTDVLVMMLDNGVSTAPGNSEAIVDFFAEALFGKALTPAERQAALDYLDTDETGNPSPYTTDRILETVGFMLGYPQFQEQ